MAVRGRSTCGEPMPAPLCSSAGDRRRAREGSTTRHQEGGGKYRKEEETLESFFGAPNGQRRAQEHPNSLHVSLFELWRGP